jgi:CHAD domain-containing protein
MALDKGEIQTSIRKLRKSLKRAERDLAPDEVHKLRTRVRRFESIESMPTVPAPDKSKLAKPLKRIRKRAGRVRDMDVLTAQLAALQGRRDPTCQTQLLEYLGAKRYRQAERLRVLLQKYGGKVRKRLKRFAAKAARAIPASRKAGRRRAPAGNSQESAQILALSSELTQPSELTRANLHPYRLKVKQLRDLVRLTAGSSQSRFLEMLGACKDAIGEWHDSEELVALAEKVVDHRPRCPLLHALKAASERKFSAGLASAEKLRRAMARSLASGGQKLKAVNA